MSEIVRPSLHEYPSMRGVDPLLATGTLLNVCKRETTSHGDLRLHYTSENGNTVTRAIISPTGIELAKANPFFLSFIDNAPEYHPFRNIRHGNQSRAVLKKTITLPEGSRSVAVKNLRGGIVDGGSGIEMFRIFRKLQIAGVLTAEPILASGNVIVTEWLEGRKIDLLSDTRLFDEYITSLEEIFRNIPVPTAQNGRLYSIDRNMDNVIILNESNPNPLKRYKTFDPVFFDGF
ncbi:MAG: hypothetical protein RLZZ455_949 [Candidatus Parcubacteria bacterium]